MTPLLHPAIWLSSRLNFRWKLLATFLLFAIPLAAVTARLVQEAGRSIERIERQRQGLALQIPLLALVRSVQDHHAATLATIHGDDSMRSRIEAAINEIQRLAPAALEHPLAGGGGLRNRQHWRTLVAIAPTDADASRGAHEQLFGGLSGCATPLSIGAALT